jgi:diacylglycerol kinase (ATP)
MSAKVKLIFNPIANLGRAWTIASALRPIISDLGDADWTGTVYPTHATELARKAADEGYDVVVAMGGDGTMHEVLNGLMQVPAERRPKMGIVPVGSGNDFAHACGISANPETALRQALTGTPRSLDIGVVRDGPGRQEYWANAIGIGFDTIVTLHSRKVPLVHGFAVYLIAVLQTILFDYQPFQLKMKIDDREWERELVMLVLMNGKREGGGFHVTPDSRPDDGHLDFLAVDKVSRLQMLRILPEVMNGTQAKMKNCHLDTFKKFELISKQPLYIHLDGEIYATPNAKVDHLSVEILPAALQVIS